MRNDTKRRMKKVRQALAYADELLHDAEFRDDVRSAAAHGSKTAKRVRKGSGLTGVGDRLANDERLRKNLRALLHDLDRASERARRKSTHRLRNTAILLGSAAGAVAAAPRVRRWATAPHFDATLEQTIEVGVPVSTAYNQWTQFEEFPRFMVGVEDVRQLDDTLLHWAANVAGRRHEWDARIVEQTPDRRIAWQSVGGKETAGAVTFSPAGAERTRVHLELTYRPDGVEWLGSAVGLDYRRVRGDLERFKQYIEDRGTETGAWRGTVDDGEARAG
jgi:uncharacterized membrane protein